MKVDFHDKIETNSAISVYSWVEEIKQREILLKSEDGSVELKEFNEKTAEEEGKQETRKRKTKEEGLF